MALVRLGSMVAQLLEELKVRPVDAHGRRRMHEVHNRTIAALRAHLPGDLRVELDTLAPALPPGSPASSEVLRVAAAQLSGWVAGVLVSAGVSDLQMASSRPFA